MVSNSPRNAPKSVKTASVDDLHVKAPRGSLIMEIALGPQNGEQEPMRRSESAKTASIDDLHVIAPWSSTTMEIAQEPQNGE